MRLQAVLGYFLAYEHRARHVFWTPAHLASCAIYLIFSTTWGTGHGGESCFDQGVGISRAAWRVSCVLGPRGRSGDVRAVCATWWHNSFRRAWMWRS